MSRIALVELNRPAALHLQKRCGRTASRTADAADPIHTRVWPAADIGRTPRTSASFRRPVRRLASSVPSFNAATGLSSLAARPLPRAMRMPGSHNCPSKARHNRICIDTAQVESLSCALQRSRRGQRIRLLLGSGADLLQSDRDLPSYEPPMGKSSCDRSQAKKARASLSGTSLGLHVIRMKR